MRRWLLLLALLWAGTGAVAQDLPPEVAASAGPRGTSGEAHDDAVGYAAVTDIGGSAQGARIAVLHPTLPAGSVVEVTALDSGRTIAALVVGPYAGAGVVALSPDAAQALGVGEGAGVRVRAITPSPQDQSALRAGQAAGGRLDAPPALLTALRRKLPARGAPRRMAETARPTRAAVDPAPRAASRARGGYGVQVAALSAPERAAVLAQQLSGHVVTSGRLYRVQLGPFPDAASAARARDAAARAGYRDARVFHSD